MILVVLSTLVGFNHCQVHYIPAQILIPTFNGTHVATNHSVYQPPIPSAINGTTREGHLILGQLQPFDRLLFNQEYFKPSRWWSSREKIIEYPKDVPAGYSRHETISHIQVLNKFYDGASARATLLKGGVGYQYVKIKLESKWGKGFRYSVQIYGH